MRYHVEFVSVIIRSLFKFWGIPRLGRCPTCGKVMIDYSAVGCSDGVVSGYQVNFDLVSVIIAINIEYEILSQCHYVWWFFKSTSYTIPVILTIVLIALVSAIRINAGFEKIQLNVMNILNTCRSSHRSKSSPQYVRSFIWIVRRHWTWSWQLCLCPLPVPSSNKEGWRQHKILSLFMRLITWIIPNK